MILRERTAIHATRQQVVPPNPPSGRGTPRRPCHPQRERREPTAPRPCWQNAELSPIDSDLRDVAGERIRRVGAWPLRPAHSTTRLRTALPMAYPCKQAPSRGPSTPSTIQNHDQCGLNTRRQHERWVLLYTLTAAPKERQSGLNDAVRECGFQRSSTS